MGSGGGGQLIRAGVTIDPGPDPDHRLRDEGQSRSPVGMTAETGTRHLKAVPRPWPETNTGEAQTTLKAPLDPDRETIQNETKEHMWTQDPTSGSVGS